MPKKLDLTDNLEKYIIENSEDLTDIQKEILDYNLSLGDQKKLQISISQAQFLQTLIKISNIKKVLEIGSFTGFSALSMALSLPDDGSLISLDKNSEFSKKAKTFYDKANENKITQIIKPALESLKELEKMINEILTKNKDKVDQYKSGKEKLFGFFVGQVMKSSGGKANPQLTNEILKKLLKG